MRFVELEEARTLRGLRLVMAAVIPSPWSQAALGLFDMKGLDYVAVRYRRTDEELQRWTGANNAPVAMFDDEPPRTGWAEILELAERLGGRVSLVPRDEAARATMFERARELLGEGGLAWNVRLLVTHASLVTDGRDGWPAPLAAYLAPKYGYAPDRVDAARARAISTLRLLGGTLAESQARGHDYLLGAAPTALDIYCATALGLIALLPHDACPMPERLRHAFETLDPAVRDAVPPSLIAHRDLMYQRHLVLPVRL